MGFVRPSTVPSSYGLKRGSRFSGQCWTALDQDNLAVGRDSGTSLGQVRGNVQFFLLRTFLVAWGLFWDASCSDDAIQRRRRRAEEALNQMLKSIVRQVDNSARKDVHPVFAVRGACPL